MAQISPNTPRRKALRYGVPVAIAGVAAVTAAMVPALADSGSPDLPKITAKDLVKKMAKSDVDQISGTVKIETDLGLPSLPGSSGGQGGGLFGGRHGGPDEEKGKDSGDSGDSGDGKSSAAPQEKLMQLASGEHRLRVASDGPDKQRLSVVEDAAEYSLVRNGGELWAYDSASNTAWHSDLPQGDAKKSPRHGGMADLTPDKVAKEALEAAEKSGTSVSVDGTAKVAGRDAYQLVLKPKGKGAADSTVKEIRIAVDGDNGAPLKFTLSPKEGGKAAVDVAYTKVDFGKPSASTFDFKPPKGTKVTEGKLDRKARGAERNAKPDLTGFGILGGDVSDWGKVAKIDMPRVAGSLIDKDKIQVPPNGLSVDGKGGAQIEKFLDGLTDEVKGDFGTGRVFHTRMVNALMTEDGTLYVGAVSKDGLLKAANADAK
ncbi:LolA family protein [Streptomyces boncukensis]|uniref:DUF2092 domain-containing protein n=1 Tax=Streptomyces boncukensis TaxID=2711219 RepID=A0A6G4WPJ9_9ACTN|nr:DUF2092 domain-containing protein [Streptomyces boncukensis]NGO67189.1 DUF2092 domain-containing protein [Streptomyces boncukensis]